jgi:hypothetical protein
MSIPVFVRKLLPKHSTGIKLLFAFLAVILLLFVLFVSFKNVIFDRALNVLSAKFESLNYVFTWKDGKVIQFNRISIGKVMLESKVDSTKFEVDSLSLRFGIISAMRGRINLINMECRDIHILYDRNNNLADAGDPATEKDIPLLSDYSAMLNRIVRRIFLATPGNLDIQNIWISILNAGDDMRFIFKNIQINQGIFHSFFYSGYETDTNAIILEGRINRKKLYAQMLAHSVDQNPCIIDFPGKHPVRAGFDTIMVSFTFPHYSQKMVTIEGTSVSKGFTLEGERLSTNRIIIDRFLSSFVMHIKPNSIELDSSSRVTFNDISLHPYVSINKNPQLTVDFKICPATWDAGHFFQSLPVGMFTSLNGFQASGNLHFFLDFALDMASVDSLRFSSSLASSDFRILGYGNDDYRMLNSEFTHHFYTNGVLAASFPVGPDNSDFTPLGNISPWLKTSVLTSEDGSFFYHRGFNPKAMRESLITNIKMKRFVRGGSTISMQLVKNVFLTRNKTIGRKLEELLIVWIIENKRLISKDRMFEVYLNIIEWGPGVFGIGQASQFYFNKYPADLNLQESLFLAGIVPFPRRYKSVFETNGLPKTYFANYMQRMKELMVSRNYILPIDTIGVNHYVFLTGPAIQAFVTPDTMKTDTLPLEELPFITLDVISPEGK